MSGLSPLSKSSIHSTPNEMDFDQIAVALEHYEERADGIRQTLGHFYSVHENYSKLHQKLQNCRQKSRIPTLIPFGSHAFIPGQIVNTHTFTVYLGEGFYREMDLKGTIKLVETRLRGVQNEILVNQREMASFGDHISHCYSILGKPMYTPSSVDKMKEKITGQKTQTNVVNLGNGASNVQSNMDSTSTTSSSRVTMTQQGTNEDGEGIFEIIEYLDDDEDPMLFNPKKIIDKSKFPNQSNTIEPPSVGASRTTSSKDSMRDVFYDSLTQTLEHFEKERQGDYSQAEVDELEEIERRLMGDAYLAPKNRITTTTTLEPEATFAAVEKKKTSFLDVDETPRILDDIIIPSGKDNVTAGDFRREFNLQAVGDQSSGQGSKSSSSLLIGEVDPDEDIVDLMTKPKASGRVEVIDDQGPDYDNYFNYLENQRQKESKQDEKKSELKSPNNAPASTAKTVPTATATVKPPAPTAPAPKTAKKVSESMDSLMKDTIQVRQRPNRAPAPGTKITPQAFPITPTITKQSIADTKPQTQMHIGPQNRNPVKTTQSGAVEAVEEEATDDGMNAYQRYMMSIGSSQSMNYFSQFLGGADDELDEGDENGAFGFTDDQLENISDLDYDDEDEWLDDEDEEYDDGMISAMQSIYKPLDALVPRTKNEVQNSQNNPKKSVNFSSQLEDVDVYTNTGFGGIDNGMTKPSRKSNTQNDNENNQNVKNLIKKTPQSADSDNEPDTEYNAMFWDHIQSIMDKEEQQKAKQESSNQSNNIGTGDNLHTSPNHYQQMVLPAQDRPVYATFGLGTTIDGSHALVAKSDDSTMYTSETLMGRSKQNKQNGQRGNSSASLLTPYPSDQPSLGGAYIVPPSPVDHPQNDAVAIHPPQPTKKISRFKQMRMGNPDGQ